MGLAPAFSQAARTLRGLETAAPLAPPHPAPAPPVANPAATEARFQRYKAAHDANEKAYAEWEKAANGIGTTRGAALYTQSGKTPRPFRRKNCVRCRDCRAWGLGSIRASARQ